MTRFPHDQFAKDFLESLLSSLGQVQTSVKISSEVREMDVYFTPDPSLSPRSNLGLLGKCARTTAVFEPYRNLVKVPQIRASQIMQMVEGYDLIIDFHNTTSDDNNCSFVGEASIAQELRGGSKKCFSPRGHYTINS